MFMTGDALSLGDAYIGQPAFFIEDLRIWKFAIKKSTNHQVVIFVDYVVTELDDFYGTDACFSPDKRTHCLVLLDSGFAVCDVKDLQALEQ